ncbi:Chalcone--flavonone isomerase [Artemisia annua]|uniref:Chalcone-flavonone isomerase family protein n=1 Tax=Artemisia annua TaxID=35608 RepID=A0A2U1LKA6_ARTAN|nr:Chalcone--flavonone isomerase [Artemisia annua]
MEKLTGIQLESVFIPPTIKPPSATKTLFLIGAGLRQLEKDGNMITVTVTGIYLEEKAIESLSIKWKGKTNVELMDSDEFYNDIYNGPFERLIYVNALVPLTGKYFCENTSGRMVQTWKDVGTYTDLDAKAVDKYNEVFKDEMFMPGSSSVLLTFLSDGSVALSIAKDGIIPEAAIAVLDHKKWAPTMLEGALGRDGVYPGARQTIASRLSDLFN